MVSITSEYAGSGIGSKRIAAGQVVCGASATAVARRTNRSRLILKNIDAAITIYIGAGTVTAVNGLPLLAGESVALQTRGPVNALAASGSPRLAYVEEYG